MAYLHTALVDLKNALENERGACDLAYPTASGLKVFQVAMPIIERVKLSFQYLVAASRLPDSEDRFREFGDGVESIAFELFGDFDVPDAVVESVRQSDGRAAVADKNLALILSDSKLKALYEESLKARPKPEGGEQHPSVDIDMLAERWVYGKFMEKAMDLIEQPPVLTAFARSQRTRLSFRRARVDLSEFNNFHMHELEAVLDAASACYDAIDAMVEERADELEKLNSPDHIAD